MLFDAEKGLGLTSWRVNLGAGLDEGIGLTSWRTGETFEVAPGEYDWTRLANQRRFIKDAKARGVKHFVAFATCQTFQSINQVSAKFMEAFVTCSDIMLHRRSEQ